MIRHFGYRFVYTCKSAPARAFFACEKSVDNLVKSDISIGNKVTN
jgi:hypothetical protein